MKLLPTVSLSVLLCAGMLSAQLHGTYTIKSDSTGDFVTLGDAGSALNHQGISGHCVFEIYGDTVPDAMELVEVPGSDSWTITFRPGPGQHPVLSGGLYDIELTHNVKFENLGFLGAGVYPIACRGFRISGCRLDIRSARTGIYLLDCSFDTIIGNIISADFADVIIMLEDSHDNVIVNNMIYGTTHPFAMGYALIYLTCTEGTRIFYNTLCHSPSTFEDSPALMLELIRRADVRNNIFILARPADSTHACVGYYPDIPDTMLIDYNCYYIESLGHIANTFGSPAPTRLDWSEWLALGFESHGLNTDPLVIGLNSLHLRQDSPCIGAAAPIPWIKTDIDGDLRDPVHPCIGADEYTGGAVTEHPIMSTPCRTASTTIVRGVLILAPNTSDKSQVTSQLLDITGRKVLDLHAGANDIRSLARGVYFVKNEDKGLISKRIVLK